MTTAITVVEEDVQHGGGSHYKVQGTITLSGNYVNGGDTISFAHGLIHATKPPRHVDITGLAGYLYQYERGTDVSNGQLRVFEAGADGAALDELASAAYPAAATGDTIRFEATFLRE